TALRDALVAAGAAYRVESDDGAATISHGGIRIAHVEINTPGDGLFDEEREELIELVSDTDGHDSAKARVIDTLRAARSTVAAQILFGTGDSETTLAKLDPLWQWLFRNYRGLLQADGEGYYDGSGIVLRME
ncbi:MAG TPA: hypothetical protein VJN70_03750, partial [Gemmatimonadaceae bacterium]|nr:hypothetical protein [Gemmatimonadaceae bacterium]